MFFSSNANDDDGDGGEEKQERFNEFFGGSKNDGKNGRQNRKHILCKFFKKFGNCKMGNMCQFSHDIGNHKGMGSSDPQSSHGLSFFDRTSAKQNSSQSKKILCKFFKNGNCKFGDKCKHSHDVSSSSEMVSDTTGHNWNSSNNDDYDEDATAGGFFSRASQGNNDEEAMMMMGNGNTGEEKKKKKKKKSDKICKYYKDGNCNKGESCNFRHVGRGGSGDMIQKQSGMFSTFDKGQGNSKKQQIFGGKGGSGGGVSTKAWQKSGAAAAAALGKTILIKGADVPALNKNNVQKHFSKFGPVHSVKILRKKKLCFVNMKSQKAAAKAAKNGRNMNGKKLRLQHLPKKAEANPPAAASLNSDQQGDDEQPTGFNYNNSNKKGIISKMDNNANSLEYEGAFKGSYVPSFKKKIYDDDDDDDDHGEEQQQTEQDWGNDYGGDGGDQEDIENGYDYNDDGYNKDIEGEKYDDGDGDGVGYGDNYYEDDTAGYDANYEEKYPNNAFMLQQQDNDETTLSKGPLKKNNKKKRVISIKKKKSVYNTSSSSSSSSSISQDPDVLKKRELRFQNAVLSYDMTNGGGGGGGGGIPDEKNAIMMSRRNKGIGHYVPGPPPPLPRDHGIPNATKGEAIVGKLLRMCHKEECNLRAATNKLSPYEVVSTKAAGGHHHRSTPDYDTCVKYYYRSDAGAEVTHPERIRPPHILHWCLNYLSGESVVSAKTYPDGEPRDLNELYIFLDNRVRSIINDLIPQKLPYGSIEIAVRCYRFYVMFDYFGIGLENYGNVHASNKEKVYGPFNDCVDAGHISPMSAEVYSYELLYDFLNRRDFHFTYDRIPYYLRTSPFIKIVIELQKFYIEGNFIKFFECLRKKVTVLQMLALCKSFPEIRYNLLYLSRNGYRGGSVAIAHLTKLYGFDGNSETTDFLKANSVPLEIGPISQIPKAKMSQAEPANFTEMDRTKESIVENKISGMTWSEIWNATKDPIHSSFQKQEQVRIRNFLLSASSSSSSSSSSSQKASLSNLAVAVTSFQQQQQQQQQQTPGQRHAAVERKKKEEEEEREERKRREREAEEEEERRRIEEEKTKKREEARRRKLKRQEEEEKERQRKLEQRRKERLKAVKARQHRENQIRERKKKEKRRQHLVENKWRNLARIAQENTCERLYNGVVFWKNKEQQRRRREHLERLRKMASAADRFLMFPYWHVMRYLAQETKASKQRILNNRLALTRNYGGRSTVLSGLTDVETIYNLLTTGKRRRKTRGGGGGKEHSSSSSNSIDGGVKRMMRRKIKQQQQQQEEGDEEKKEQGEGEEHGHHHHHHHRLVELTTRYNNPIMMVRRRRTRKRQRRTRIGGDCNGVIPLVTPEAIIQRNLRYFEETDLQKKSSFIDVFFDLVICGATTSSSSSSYYYYGMNKDEDDDDDDDLIGTDELRRWIFLKLGVTGTSNGTARVWRALDIHYDVTSTTTTNNPSFRRMCWSSSSSSSSSSSLSQQKKVIFHSTVLIDERNGEQKEEGGGGGGNAHVYNVAALHTLHQNDQEEDEQIPPPDGHPNPQNYTSPPPTPTNTSSMMMTKTTLFPPVSRDEYRRVHAGIFLFEGLPVSTLGQRNDDISKNQKVPFVFDEEKLSCSTKKRIQKQFIQMLKSVTTPSETAPVSASKFPILVICQVPSFFRENEKRVVKEKVREILLDGLSKRERESIGAFEILALPCVVHEREQAGAEYDMKKKKDEKKKTWILYPTKDSSLLLEEHVTWLAKNSRRYPTTLNPLPVVSTLRDCIRKCVQKLSWRYRLYYYNTCNQWLQIYSETIKEFRIKLVQKGLMDVVDTWPPLSSVVPAQVVGTEFEFADNFKGLREIRATTKQQIHSINAWLDGIAKQLTLAASSSSKNDEGDGEDDDAKTMAEKKLDAAICSVSRQLYNNDSSSLGTVYSLVSAASLISQTVDAITKRITTVVVAPKTKTGAIKYEGERKNHNPRSKKRKQEAGHLAAAAAAAAAGTRKVSSIIGEQENMSKRAKKRDDELKKPWEPSLDPLEREIQWDALEDLLEDTRTQLQEAKRMESQRISRLDCLSNRLDDYYSSHTRIEK